VVLKSDAYGKNRVRLIYADRTQVPHGLKEISVAISLQGDFAAAYTNGDNSHVLPTDTMKNTVYVLARKFGWSSSESFAQTLARHFVEQVPHVSSVTVEIEEVPWQQIPGCPTAFSQSGNERRTVRLTLTGLRTTLISGIKGLQILKTRDSAFAGFMNDEFTTLPESQDRLLGTVLEARWEYLKGEISFNEAHREIRATLLKCFGEHKSLSVQHTLFAMGAAVLEKMQAVSEICLVMPNKHCLLADLQRFGLDNPNMIFIPTDEPSGYIEARIGR
jgi:urate oxidase